MADVKMEMETGEMTLTMMPVAAGPKIRKFPQVPQEMKDRAREMELEKQDLARQRAALLPDYDPALTVRTRKHCEELRALRVEMLGIQSKVNMAKKAKERLKQTEAADRAARRLGNAT